MKDVLRLVLEIFPDAHDWIRHLYETDDDFRLLCRDHADALKVAQNWRKSVKVKAPNRVIEYQSLVDELQADIHQWLEKVKMKI